LRSAAHRVVIEESKGGKKKDNRFVGGESNALRSKRNVRRVLALTSTKMAWSEKKRGDGIRRILFHRIEEGREDVTENVNKKKRGEREMKSYNSEYRSSVNSSPVAINSCENGRG